MTIATLPTSPAGEISHGQAREKINETITSLNSLTALNVVNVFTESDFGVIVPATRIDVTPNVTFNLMKPITQTLPFLIDTGKNMEIRTTSRLLNTLTYTNSAPQFAGVNIGTLAIFDVIFNGSENGVLFDINGGTISLKFPDFNRYDSLGTVQNLVDFFAPGVFAEIISSGLSLIDCGGGTIVDSLFIAQEGNTLSMFDISGASSGEFQLYDNIFDNDSSASFINIDGATFPSDNAVNLIGNNISIPANFFAPGSLTQVDGRILSSNNKAVPISTITSEAVLSNNAMVTDIPAANAKVIIAASTWVGSEESRMTVNSDGSSTYGANFSATLRLDGNITLEPSSSSKELSCSFARQDAARVVVTFTNATNLINENSTPLVDGDNITFNDNAGTLPAGLREDIIYFVVSQLTNSFQVSYTLGGAAIAFTTDGSGTNSYAAADLHGSSPSNSIAANSPRNLVPQALENVGKDDKTFIIVENLDDSVNIEVTEAYYRVAI